MTYLLDEIWGFLSDKVALVIYIAILLVSIVVLITYNMTDDNKREEKIVGNFSSGAVQGNVGGTGAVKEESENAHRFYTLSEIDEKMKNVKEEKTEKLTFDKLCERFRAYSASKLKLYYSEEDIEMIFTRRRIK